MSGASQRSTRLPQQNRGPRLSQQNLGPVHGGPRPFQNNSGPVHGGPRSSKQKSDPGYGGSRSLQQNSGSLRKLPRSSQQNHGLTQRNFTPGHQSPGTVSHNIRHSQPHQLPHKHESPRIRECGARNTEPASTSISMSSRPRTFSGDEIVHVEPHTYRRPQYYNHGPQYYHPHHPVEVDIIPQQTQYTNYNTSQNAHYRDLPYHGHWLQHYNQTLPTCRCGN